MRIKLNLSASTAKAWSLAMLMNASLVLQAQPPQDYDIYLFNARTGSVNQLTTFEGLGEFNPSFSPFGIAVAHDVVDFFNLEHDIFITLLSGSSYALPGGEGGNDASWSKCGFFIAFDRNTFEANDASIYYVSIFGGTRKLIRENAIDPDWSPFGYRVAFTDFDDFSIRTASLLSGSETVVVPFGLNPAWSPHGGYIAYTDGNNIFRIRVNIAGVPIGTEEQVTFDDENTFNQQPHWSPKGKYIIFHSNRESFGGTDFDIWKVKADGSESPVRVTGLAGTGDFDPDVTKSPFGKLVAFAGFTNPAPPLADAGYRLDQNYPNPFTSGTALTFEVPEPSFVEVEIYTHTGQLVRQLTKGEFPAGVHTLSWDGVRENKIKAAPGMYLYTLRAGNYTKTKLLAIE